jgi:hypothetical protein
MMSPVIRIVRNDIGPSVRRFSSVMKRGLRDVTRQAAKGITRRVIDVTPPASEGSAGQDARRAGEGKISRQMSSVFAPKKLKGRRKITVVFGRRLKKPVYVKTKEKHPDVAGLYRQNSRARGTATGITTRKVHNKFYVDVRKFQAVLAAKKSKVGTLAAGWTAGATALDLPVQAWISRHGSSGGMVRIDTAGDRMRVVVENFAPGLPPHIRADLARRIPYAVQYQANAMERAIAAVKQKTCSEVGIKQGR